ncbi:MAG: hypothetical protein RJB38_1650 [Pseudomonadota bacterium]
MSLRALLDPVWSEAQPINCFEILGTLVRQELHNERVERLDLSYLTAAIDELWLSQREMASRDSFRNALRSRLMEKIQPWHLELIRKVGTKEVSVAALFLERVFSLPEKELAESVQEVVSDLAGITDIHYPYEDHKELFPKQSDAIASDWGRGMGVIRPHSDDLYEFRDINAMCLTVCRDLSSTPTWFWLLKDLVACLTDEELGLLCVSEAKYLSGRNVEGKIVEVQKPIFRLDRDEGIGMRLDFRVDDSIGPRMRPCGLKTQKIFEKLKAHLSRLKPITSNPRTGSVSLLANFKVLHGRARLQAELLSEGEASRILFRSKGTK